jgi:hypothetical protein
VFFTNAGVKENRTTLLCKKSGGDAEIGEVEDQDDARSWKRTLLAMSGDPANQDLPAKMTFDK